MSIRFQCTETPPAQLAMVVTGNLQQKTSAAAVTWSSSVTVEVGRDSPVFTSDSANGDSVVTPAISALPKHPQPPQLGSEDRPTAGSVVGTSRGGNGKAGHERIYTTGEKPYNCQHDMFIETANGRWHCVECNSSLRGHTRTQTEERPYQCQYCTQAFSRASTL